MADSDGNTSSNETPVNASNSGKGGPHKMKKYGFGLSPEEQDIAYTLKSIWMRKIDEQNQKLVVELELAKRFKLLKKSQKHK